ncbi:hypothetical protein CBL_20576 [Carabus blaptoides fortunei]
MLMVQCPPVKHSIRPKHITCTKWFNLHSEDILRLCLLHLKMIRKSFIFNMSYLNYNYIYFSVNLEIIPEYAKYLSKNGINGVLVNGTSGEGMSLNVTERKQLTEEWMKVCKETKQTLMVQVGGAPLPDVLELAAHAEKLNVDALLCLPELYFKPYSSEQLIEYFSLISKAAPNTPLLYYHIPAFTNVNINMPEFLTKADGIIDTLVGIKFTSTDLVEGAECIKVCRGKYAIFLGADQLLTAAYALGFDSAIATTFNIYPELGQQIRQSFNKEHTDLQAAQTAQTKLSAQVNNITKHGTWVTTMKSAMNIVSPINVGPVRAPLQELTKNQKEEMRRALTTQ